VNRRGELNADAVGSKGSVQRSGNRYASLRNWSAPLDDRHLWQFMSVTSRLLALQDEVASAIAKQIETNWGAHTNASTEVAGDKP